MWNKSGKPVEGLGYISSLMTINSMAPLYLSQGVATASYDEFPADPGTSFPSYLVQSLLQAVSNLSNHITHNDAHKSILKLYSLHRELFSSPVLFARVHQYLARYDFELRVRQFVLDLFHRSLRFEELESWAWLDSVRFC